MRQVIWATRYALPAIICLVGLVFIVIDPSGNWEGAAALIGAGLSVLLLNFLYRMGVEGDRDRDREAAQRRYYDEHGHWPDEQRRG
ncbi:hypothetical protein [Conexibacter woesei]|uniref:Uncharacterized protein n=1 Tax=Conexibacter woesei (strain DSM 14684 / CCUG 47730 / CIP 108061 / JCM 11494 / NBRC 100937 / ID131577) TaxID=469383 RepID=D3FEJ2_CONWI|nr:hypothetical protein [Conexibacter woesei]ADB49666.1 hypothetical protein Cwoe_1237 [Conexibacter woesei DSM 14684]